jgi:tetratricopeptide (TPR) repeat protein
MEDTYKLKKLSIFAAFVLFYNAIVHQPTMTSALNRSSHLYLEKWCMRFFIALLSVGCTFLTISLNNASAQRRTFIDEPYYRYYDEPEYRINESLEAGVRHLKLGNTYREARKYNLAQSYLRLGIDIARARGSKYWEAVGNEYAGLLFRDLGDRLTSLDYLRRAEYLYKQVLSPLASETSIDALRGIIRDTQLDYYAFPPSTRTSLGTMNNAYLYNSQSLSAYQTENQRLRDINRALQVRISDLEYRIRQMEQPVVGR